MKIGDVVSNIGSADQEEVDELFEQIEKCAPIARRAADLFLRAFAAGMNQATASGIHSAIASSAKAHVAALENHGFTRREAIAIYCRHKDAFAEASKNVSRSSN